MITLKIDGLDGVTISAEAEAFEDEAKTKELLKPIEDAIAAIKAENVEQKAELDRTSAELEALHLAVGETPVEEIPGVLESGKAFRQSLEEELVKFGTICNLIPKDKDSIESYKTLFGKMTLKELQLAHGQYKKVYETSQKQPAGQLPENLQNKAAEIKVEPKKSEQYDSTV